MSNPQHEPTMEEILASIRKIISEDGPEAAAPAETAPPPPPAPAPVAAPEPVPAPQPVAETVHDDVLELTQEVEPPPAPPAPPAPPPEDLVFQSVTPAAPAPASDLHSDIFSDHTRKAMEDTFNNIPDEPAGHTTARSAAPIAPVDGSTVESVFERAVRESFEPVLQRYLSDNSAAVIERMTPAIREWMDEHFPALLEGAVRAEVERVVKARGTKR
jgi:cell pole-organizing protein PopZ